MARLVSGDHVSIVGGGPAGSFAALELLEAARKNAVKLDVTIFEPRDFLRPGPGGCNHCAGMLSHRALKGLDSCNLKLPDDVVQSQIKSYAIHLHGEVRRVTDTRPERAIPAVYRGSGPRDLVGSRSIASFDQFLLDAALERGAKQIPHRCFKVSWEDKPVVYSHGERVPSDLVILASGVNSRAPLEPSFGYHPPLTSVMAQDEIPRPPSWPRDRIEAFFRNPPGLVFGALIPKGDFINISLLGQGLPTDAVAEFLEMRGAEAGLAITAQSLCGCTPRVAIRPAPRYYGDRWVAVGDAGVTRFYKDGIGSAWTTARAAVRAAVEGGVSGGSFRRRYAPTFRSVARDNVFGRMLFRMWSMTLESGRLSHAWVDVLDKESSLPPANRRMHRILWSMLSGDESYETLFWRAVSPKMMFTTFRSALRAS